MTGSRSKFTNRSSYFQKLQARYSHKVNQLSESAGSSIVSLTPSSQSDSFYSSQPCVETARVPNEYHAISLSDIDRDSLSSNPVISHCTGSTSEDYETFNCEKCKKSFKKKISLLQHNKVSHPVKLDNAKQIPAAILTQNNEILSKVHHFPVELDDAEQIPAAILTLSNEIIPKGSLTFSCKECRKNFKTEDDMSRHDIAKHKKNERQMNGLETENVSAGFVQPLLHGDVYKEMTKLSLEFSSKRFNMEINLQRHINSVQAEMSKLSSELNAKKFSMEKNLQDHLIKAKAEMCEIPAENLHAKFVAELNLQRYIKSVNQEICQLSLKVSAKKFSLESDLLHHINIVQSDLGDLSLELHAKIFSLEAGLYQKMS